jgi:hypothetical protein
VLATFLIKVNWPGPPIAWEYDYGLLVQALADEYFNDHTIRYYKIVAGVGAVTWDAPTTASVLSIGGESLLISSPYSVYRAARRAARLEQAG